MLVIPAALLLRSYLLHHHHHRPYPVTRNRILQSLLLSYGSKTVIFTPKQSHTYTCAS
jgi:hypothetical protein